MGERFLSRARYRAGQFVRAVWAYVAPVRGSLLEAARQDVPAAAWPLFRRMPRNDQWHSLRVWADVRKRSDPPSALLQAALLHDAGKAGTGLTLLHRVAVVLLKAFRPGLLARWAASSKRPAGLAGAFWAHANHPARGAALAEAAGCERVAVVLIRHHQDGAAGVPDAETRRLLLLLQAADDNN